MDKLQVKTCSMCKENLPYSQFYHNKTNKDGYRYECINCLNKTRGITLCLRCEKNHTKVINGLCQSCIRKIKWKEIWLDE